MQKWLCGVFLTGFCYAGFAICESAFRLPERAEYVFESQVKRLERQNPLRANRDLSDFKESVEDKKSAHFFDSTGVTHFSFRMVGHSQGKKLFLKEIRRPIFPWQENHKELAVLLTLQILKAPVLFEGVGHIAIDWHKGEFTPHIRPIINKGVDSGMMVFAVNRFQEGDNWFLDPINNLRHNQPSPFMTAKTHKQLEKLKDFFIKYHILPKDLQIRISTEGYPYIIDPGQFEFLGGTRGEHLDYFWRSAKDVADFLAPHSPEFEHNLRHFMATKKEGTTYEELVQFYLDQLVWPVPALKPELDIGADPMPRLANKTHPDQKKADPPEPTQNKPPATVEPGDLVLAPI